MTQDCDQNESPISPSQMGYLSRSPMGIEVDRLVRQREDAVKLAGEILGTLQLPQNRPTLRGLGIDLASEPWLELLKKWDAQWKSCSGKE